MDLLGTIVDAVIEDSNFNDSIVSAVKDEISDTIREDVDDAVNEAFRNLDVSDKVNEALDDATNKIQRNFRNLENEVNTLRDTVETLLKANAELLEAHEMEKLTRQMDVRELSKLVQHTRTTLRKIPIIRRYF